MAQRRMFSLQIIDTDAFLDMPATTQNLYFHLGMRADDDGFVSNPKKIMKITGASDDDLRVLLTKQFILNFDNGIVVLKHWKIHNYIQKDRYKETIYIDEKAQLALEENNMYTKCIQNGDTGKVSIGKVSIGKVNIGKIIYSNDFFQITENLYNVYLETYPDLNLIKEFQKMNAWLISNPRKRYKNYNRFINNWLNNSRIPNKNKIKSEQEQIKEIQERVEYFRQIGESQNV